MEGISNKNGDAGTQDELSARVEVETAPAAATRPTQPVLDDGRESHPNLLRHNIGNVTHSMPNVVLPPARSDQNGDMELEMAAPVGQKGARILHDPKTDLQRADSAPASLEPATTRVPSGQPQTHPKPQPQIHPTQLDENQHQEVIRVVPYPDTAANGNSMQEGKTRNAGVGGNDSGGGSVKRSIPEIPMEEEIGDFLKSPQGRDAIVERSPMERYIRFQDKLGSGASKDVYRAWDSTEGIEVAWNVVSLSGIPFTETKRITNEVHLLERLHHPNIISFYGSWVNRERLEVIFVTEILSSGTLKSFIERVQVIRLKIAKKWAIQILKGLEYLHSQDPPVIHRDLKCDNIFINGARGDLRIGDLGLSTVHTNGKVLSVLGTPEFMAPDLYEETPYNEKIDIYAFGMCLVEIFTKEIPYRECQNIAQIYKKVASGKLPDCLGRLKSGAARDFIILCLGYKDENGTYVRPSAAELLQHPFLQKGENDDDEISKMLYDKPQPTIPEEIPPHNADADKPKTDKPVLGFVNENKTDMTMPPTHPEDQTPPVSSQQQQQPILPVVRDESTASVPSTHSMSGDSATSCSLGSSATSQHQPQPQPPLAQPQPPQPQPPPPQPQPQPQLPLSQPQLQPAHTFGAVNVRPDKTKEENQFVVAAAVIEDESPLVQPYADEILKLITTLSMNGENKNVQFDFHLVQDDAVKVAREMVSELGIPEEAVLEISETVSALAREARMSQDAYHRRKRKEEKAAAAAAAGIASIGVPVAVTSSDSVAPFVPGGQGNGAVAEPAPSSSAPTPHQHPTPGTIPTDYLAVVAGQKTSLDEGLTAAPPQPVDLNTRSISVPNGVHVPLPGSDEIDDRAMSLGQTDARMAKPDA